MKKFVSMVTALTLVLAMGMNVCAANSVSAETSVVESENVSDLEVEELDSTVADEAGNELGTVAGVEATNYAPVASFNVNGAIEEGKTAVITFAVIGVTAEDDVVVLHNGANGWEQCPATAGVGTVTAKFTNFSPVVIFVKVNNSQPAPEQPEPEQPAKVIKSENVSNLALNKLSPAVAEEAESKLETVAKVDDPAEYEQAATFEISGTIEEGKVAVITFEVAGVKSGDDVVVLHKGARGWEPRPATAGNGTVTAEFESFSPVVIYVKANTSQPVPEQPAVEQPAPQQPAGTVSPKTADTSVVFVAGVAVIAVAGLVISKKKFV